MSIMDVLTSFTLLDELKAKSLPWNCLWVVTGCNSVNLNRSNALCCEPDEEAPFNVLTEKRTGTCEGHKCSQQCGQTLVIEK